jgi:hypothetical protein
MSGHVIGQIEVMKPVEADEQDVVDAISRRSRPARRTCERGPDQNDESDTCPE